MAGEWYHILYNNVYGVRTTSLRLTNTYGPGMRVKDARQTFLGIWIRRLLEGAPIEVWGGTQLRDFSYVDDAVEAMLLAATSDGAKGEIYNVGGGPVVSLSDLAALLVEVAGEGEVVHREFPAERQVIDIGDYYADTTKIEQALGWQPRVELREGLARTLGYYRKNLQEYV
jgi:UDP-glucose 4-epimerase